MLTSAEVIEMGTAMARASYGGSSVGPEYDGTYTGNDDVLNYDDDYRGYVSDLSLYSSQPGAVSGEWVLLDQDDLNVDLSDGANFTAGGLYRSDVLIGDPDHTNAGEALVTQHTSPTGEVTVVLAFRGSDGNDAFYEGQTFDEEALAYYYLGMKPVIDAVAAYAASPANNVTNVIVVGHSLGGAIVDLFGIADADQFAGVDLYILSLASAGVEPDITNAIYAEQLELDSSAYTVDASGHITSITYDSNVDGYISIAHSEDRVFDSLLQPFGSDLTPTITLITNIHPEQTYEIILPNIENTDVDYNKFLGVYNSGFGAEHNAELYWANLSALTADPLFGLLTNQTIIMGLTDYAAVTDIDGELIGGFTDFIHDVSATYFDDSFEKSLTGTTGADYILGLDGNDWIYGGSGGDLLSGGAGNDFINGDAGWDIMSGGRGNDVFRIGTEEFSSGLQSIFTVSDRIIDFDQGNTGVLSSTEDDVLDISSFASLTSTGVLDASNVRVCETPAANGLPSGSAVQIKNTNGDWVTVVRLDGVTAGHAVLLSLTPSLNIWSPTNVTNFVVEPAAGQTTWTIDPVTPQVTEGDTTITFTITRKGENLDEQDVWISTTTVHGSANGGDYVGKLNEKRTFAAGSEVLTVTITINEDDYDEANETFGIIVQLDPDDPYTKYVVGTTFTVLDDDAEEEIFTGSYFEGTSANENWVGTGGMDTAYGGSGDDVISGQGGADLLAGGRGNDTLFGGSGNDALFGGVYVDGGTGDDYIDTIVAGAATLVGGSGIDEIVLIASVSTSGLLMEFIGSAQQVTYGDILILNFEVFDVTLGSGDDRVVVEDPATQMRINAGDGLNALEVDFSKVSGGLEYTFTDPYGVLSLKVVGTGSGLGTSWFESFNSFVVYGGYGKDIFWTNLPFEAYTATLYGGAGQDEFNTSSNSVETIFGGVGYDFVQVYKPGLESDEVIYVNLNSGTEFRLSDGTFVDGCEVVQLTLGAGDDYVEFDMPVIVPGFRGNNIDGNSGRDFVSFNLSNFEENLFFRIEETSARAGLAYFPIDANAYDIEEFRGEGGDGNDTFYIIGNGMSSTLIGNGGADAISSGSFNDSLYGGSGNDVLTVTTGIDRIEGGSGTDVLYLSGTRSQYTFSGNRYDLVAQGSQASGHGRKTIGDVEFIVIDGQTYTANELLGIPNAPPRITSNGGGSTSSISIAENARAVTTVKATDSDAIVPLTYSIVGGDDAARFSINASTGALTFVNTPNAESPNDTGADNVYQVVVQVSDGSDVDTQTISVTVTDVNEFTPTITSGGGGANASVSIAENGRNVTTVAATDQDRAETLVYSITGGVDAELFEIDSDTGALRFKSAPDRESPADADGNNVYVVVVRVSDGSFSDTQTISVTVTNVNEQAPVISSNGGGASAAISRSENQTAVTTVVASDADAGTSVSYAIVGGADAARFTINSTTGVLSFVAAPNFESPSDSGQNNVYDVVVRASDGSLSDTQTISVTITNVNETTPVITSNGGGTTGSIQIAENGRSVTTVVATDTDTGDELAYSIVGGADAALFEIDEVTGALRFVDPPDFENASDADQDNIYVVHVAVSDGTFSDSQTLQVSVVNGTLGFTITGTEGADTIVPGPPCLDNDRQPTRTTFSGALGVMTRWMAARGSTRSSGVSATTTTSSAVPMSSRRLWARGPTRCSPRSASRWPPISRTWSSPAAPPSTGRAIRSPTG